MIAPAAHLLQRCVSVDLEVDPTSATVFAFAAVRSGGPSIVAGKGNIENGLDRLERELGDAAHVLGHNIIRHDLPHLVAMRPKLAPAFGAPIDTLWLNPLAFPRNPYHHLVKHYHDGRLQAGHVNDPERDALLVLEVLDNQLEALAMFNAGEPDAVTAYHYLGTRMEHAGGFDAVFRAVRGADAPPYPAARAAIAKLLAGRACQEAVAKLLVTLASPRLGWPTAYAISWILVAGGDSVMPPWVRHQFPDAARIVKQLRDTTCERPDCAWCREQNDPVKALERWFGFSGFRPQPVDEMGRPLQERIVDEAMRGGSILGILPTGTGKSVCYQIPALSKFDKTGALTVVISPLIPANRWTDLIAEGIAALAHELNTKSMPVPDLIEWFAEWARDARSEQRSLLLLTAHRAKGLEFDDVVILNGGWDRPSKGEDADAPRRLFYVAITRARRSLTIMADGRHPFAPPGNQHVLRRAAPPVAPDSSGTAVYQVPDLKTVDLSWAGRLGGSNPALGAIASAKAGDPIRLTRQDDAWMLQAPDGQALGRMARSWSPPQGLAFLRGEVGAIIRWRKADSGEEFRDNLRRDEWEVVVPELVFGPPPA